MNFYQTKMCIIHHIFFFSPSARKLQFKNQVDDDITSAIPSG